MVMNLFAQMKKSKYIFTFITNLLLCLAVSTNALANNANEENDYILLINTYTEATPWSIDVIKPIMDIASQSNKLDLHVENMNTLLIENEKDLLRFENIIFSHYRIKPPKMIVLVGFGSTILIDRLVSEWGRDIPIMICSEKDYISNKENLFSRKAILPENRIPLSDLQKKYNITLLQKPVYPEKNLDLMLRMLPEMKKLIFIGDKTYISQQTDSDLKQYIKEKYPFVDYQFISSALVTTDSLLTDLNYIDPVTTGLLFSSWFQKLDFLGYTLMMTNPYYITETSPVPIFSLYPADIDNKNALIGGYFNDTKEYEEKEKETATRILRGERPSNIPFFENPDGVPVFNYNNLLFHKIDPKLCPKETILFNKPPTFWKKYKDFLIGGGILLVLIIIGFQYRRLRTLEKLKVTQQRNLKLSEQYTNLVDNMPIIYMRGTLIKDNEGNITDATFLNVNHYFNAIFYPNGEVIGKKCSEVLPDIMSEFLHYSNLCLKEKHTITYLSYNKNKNIFYDIVMNITGNNKFIDVFCVDSTALHNVQIQLRSTNQKLAMALEVANIIPWRWNLKEKTIICDMNRIVKHDNETNITGEELIVAPEEQYFSKVHKKDRERLLQAYQNLIEGKISKVKEDVRILNKYHFEWVEIQATIESRDENEKPISLVGSSLVITERKKMEEDLLSAKENAEESNKLKSAFLANMSHEIRTPLNAIIGFSEILASTNEEKEKQEYISIIENNNALLLQLINDILDLSKIEAGSMEFTYSDFDLNDLMKELERSLLLKISPDKYLTLHSELSLQDCHIHSEKNRLSQLIINLVSNAIKFTDKGVINFGYTVKGKMLHFYVTDTGCGIPKDKLDSVFGRFIKLNKFVPGTGLGLAICRSIVKRMGGEIGVISQENQGSTFWFEIPYLPITIEKKIAGKEQPEEINEHEITILVAEDNEYNYKLIESILKKEYKLIHAWNGREAVELYLKHKPQIILMDINMPVMNGYEATREIRKYAPNVPIIAVTAFAYASDEEKIKEHGFNDYAPKPINASILKKQIIANLQRHFIFL